MRFDEIRNRLTGISCPIFGISWNPPESESAIARRVITFLEDRRVLYNPYRMETPDVCVHSVTEIRHFLTDELAEIDSSRELAQNLRAMRAACRKFLNMIHDKDDRIIRNARHDDHWAFWHFHNALGEMRGVFGIHIAILAVKYGLDVEDELATILPEQVEE